MQAAISKDPNNPDYHSLYAYSLRKGGTSDMDLVFKHYNEALRILGDGDASVDRAVGPMQFIPSTWRKWASDGNGDGLGDPQQIDDAALAAARYLCAGGRDMASPSGWWAGILSYNNSTEYAQKVFGLADGYAKGAKSERKQGCGPVVSEKQCSNPVSHSRACVRPPGRAS